MTKEYAEKVEPETEMLEENYLEAKTEEARKRNEFFAKKWHEDL